MTIWQASLVSLVVIILCMSTIAGLVLALVNVAVIILLCLFVLVVIKVKRGFTAARKSLKCDMELNNPY